MSARRDFDLERAELEAVLASESLAKSPNLVKFLRYIGLKSLEGEGHTLKQYNIGVEALGRSPDFDPKQDPIVRVEAQRLREKLKRYYETEGVEHTVVITLEVGHYSPQFIRRTEIPSAPSGSRTQDGMDEAAEREAISPDMAQQPGTPQRDSTSAAVPELKGTFVETRQRVRRWQLLVALPLLGLLIGFGVLSFSRSKLGRATVALFQAAKASSSNAAGGGRAIRILAGSAKEGYVDRLGENWSTDRYFVGGRAIVEPNVLIARAPDPALFKTARQGEFSYKIPLKPGTYELHLYFTETDYGPGTRWGGGEVSRLFHIDMNGKRLFTDFDIFSDAGGNNIADERVIAGVSPASDGYLHLDFIKANEFPVLNAIAVFPSPNGRIQPLRIVAQDQNYTDHGGRVWGADRYFSGGRPTTVGQTVTGTSDPGVYSGERYGHFTYAIPVPEGRYNVTLRFAETYFGPHNPGRTGGGNRLFNVYCNGNTLLRNFDIFKEAGGENRAVDKTFHGLQPNAQGKLILTFEPVKDYASINAIEVIEEPM